MRRHFHSLICFQYVLEENSDQRYVQFCFEELMGKFFFEREELKGEMVLVGEQLESLVGQKRWRKLVGQSAE